MKTMITISIDSDLIGILRADNLPISSMVQEALEIFMKTDRFKAKRDSWIKLSKIPKERIRRVKKLIKQGGMPYFWAEKLSKWYQIDITEDDLIACFDLDHREETKI